MSRSGSFGARQQALFISLLDALNESLDLRRVLDTSLPLLTQVVPADQGAVCVSNPAAVGGYDWSTFDFSVDWFSAYAELAPHDFVRTAVASRPNVVLRDTEMIPRAKLEVNMMYRRSLEVRMPLTQVMSVMLASDASWHAGITLYRGRRRSFSDGDRAMLQRLVPLFGNAARNCKLFADVSRRGTLVESVLVHSGFETILMESASVQVDRTSGAAALIARWFAPAELSRLGLPLALSAHLEEAIRRHGGRGKPLPPWTRPGAHGARLEVSIVPLPEAAHRTVWAVIFREVQSLPEAWNQRLTPREREVASRVVLGWDSQAVAEDLCCELTTVKKHIQNIFNKLGIASRAALCHLAGQQR